MSTVAVNSRLNQTVRFYQTTLGKKAVMAITGIVLFGYVVGHMIGNLQVFLGPEKINQYAEFLHSMPGPLWAVRLVLLACIVLHIVASVQLTALKNTARPVEYVKKQNITSSYASRTMMWSGPIVAAFLIYHIMHFTIGVGGTPFQDLRPYENVVAGFRVWPVSVAYIIAVSLLGMHLYHGLWSMFQTLGMAHPRYTPWMKQFAVIFSLAVTLGFIAVPVAVLTGVVG